VSYRFPWHRLSDEQLLDLRICDLPIKIKGSFLEPHIKRLYSELNNRGIRFKPHVWLAEEWFSPDGVPGHSREFARWARSPLARAGMVAGAKALALTALDLLASPETLAQAKQDFTRQGGSE